MSENVADRVTGLLGVLLSLTYLWIARGIEDSLLADAVGASGVPTAVGVTVLVTSLALLLKSLLPTGQASGVASPTAPEPQMETGGAIHPHRKAAGLLAILAGYILLLPLLGYVPAMGLLIGSVAWYAGARQRVSLLTCMVLSGPLLWLMFDWALGIRLPVGLWPQWMAR